MKGDSLTSCWVVIADQRRSRRGSDLVPAALTALAARPMRLAFERTAGDEIQGLTDQVEAVVGAVVDLTRLGPWRIGVGYGRVDLPLPASTRAARGQAYLLARSAIADARTAPGEVALRSGADSAAADRAEAGLQVLRALLQRRTPEGWQAVDLLDAGRSVTDAAAELGVSTSAVSQRLSRAAHGAGERGIALAAWLLDAVANEATR